MISMHDRNNIKNELGQAETGPQLRKLPTSAILAPACCWLACRIVFFGSLGFAIRTSINCDGGWITTKNFRTSAKMEITV